MSNIKMGLTIEEAAECTGIGRNTMRKLVDWGKLPVLKVGRKAIIRRDTLERFMSVNQGRNLLNENDVRKVESPFSKPSAFESEIHPSHKSSICTLGISPLQGAMYHSFGQSPATMIQKKTARCFLRCPSAYAAETAATDFSVAKRVCPSREEGVYGKTQFYTDVKATQCQGKNILYHKPRKTGKSLCHLPHR